MNPDLKHELIRLIQQDPQVQQAILLALAYNLKPLFKLVEKGNEQWGPLD